ncbi:MAG TPA: DUF2892 domain-containing protein [Hellea balneolensis]|uniref:DUF2892 domain-containing protein n=1 Tax=Hellea balneolensis TaxID=287478 RepID=A0A7C5R1I1_9PROT|nr:DUF2892 domain-containing protein [Hellea balneolensis]
MNLDRSIFAFGGTVVLVSLALGHWVNPYWHLLTAFAGANMLQASVTGFCPVAKVFKALGIKSGSAF